MNNHENIAVENSINLDKYEIKSATVKDKWFIEYFGIILFFLVSIIFITGGILYIQYLIPSIICISLGGLFFVFGLIILLHMMTFKLSFNDECISYKDLFKNEKINVKDLKKFKVENHNTRYYTVEIFYGYNKNIKYHISYTNKENFIFLLNLLKLGIEQVY